MKVHFTIFFVQFCPFLHILCSWNFSHSGNGRKKFFFLKIFFLDVFVNETTNFFFKISFLYFLTLFRKIFCKKNSQKWYKFSLYQFLRFSRFTFFFTFESHKEFRKVLHEEYKKLLFKKYFSMLKKYF